MTRPSGGDSRRERLWLSGADDRHTARMRRGGSARRVSESVTLPQDRTAPGTARRFTAAACDAAGLTGDVRDSAVLLVSEVVTNAVVHAQSAPRLTVWTTDTGVRIEVGDTSPTLPTRAAAADGDLSGRGITVLDTCASAWGCRAKRQRQGKVVWFIVRSHARAAEPAGAR